MLTIEGRSPVREPPKSVVPRRLRVLTDLSTSAALNARADDAAPESTVRYLVGRRFQTDRPAAIDAWPSNAVLGGAGLFIYTTYAALPALTAVGVRDGADALMLRGAVEEGKERILLARMMGLSPESSCAGGIANPAVRRMLRHLGELHLGMTAMRRSYLNFFAGIVAESALRVRAELNAQLPSDRVAAYWRYMSGHGGALSRDVARGVAARTGPPGLAAPMPMRLAPVFGRQRARA